jgi:hypothetical protein
MYSSHPIFPAILISYKGGGAGQDDIGMKSKESQHWLNQTSTSNRYIAVSEVLTKNNTGPDNRTKSPPVYMYKLVLKISHYLYNWQRK